MLGQVSPGSIGHPTSSIGATVQKKRLIASPGPPLPSSVAHTIENLFQAGCRKYHFNETLVRLSTEQFIRPQESQLSLSLG